MGVGELVQQAIHGATGVPRLYAAALRAGTGPAGATQVLLISSGALRLAAERASGVPGRQNAVRHFLWQALLTARFDRGVAQRVADAQEQGSPDVADSRVDRHNNAVGQAYGDEHARELGDLPVRTALERLLPVALAKWDTDELEWVRPH
jgi:hypothetical protein